MGARTDLQDVAAALARQAHVAAYPPVAVGSGLGDHQQAARLAAGARDALQAAHLIDVEPAPIIAALERLERRVQAGVFEAMEISGTEGAIDCVADILEHLQREVEIGAAVQHGYVELRDLLRGLHRDFSAASTDTAARIAMRIEAGLESADDAIKTAQAGEG